jgi:hypothetical protein
MMDAIVVLTVAGNLAFTAAWVFRPALRARIERPKYRFQSALEQFEAHTVSRAGNNAEGSVK